MAFYPCFARRVKLHFVGRSYETKASIDPPAFGTDFLPHTAAPVPAPPRPLSPPIFLMTYQAIGYCAWGCFSFLESGAFQINTATPEAFAPGRCMRQVGRSALRAPRHEDVVADLGDLEPGVAVARELGEGVVYLLEVGVGRADFGVQLLGGLVAGIHDRR